MTFCVFSQTPDNFVGQITAKYRYNVQMSLEVRCNEVRLYVAIVLFFLFFCDNDPLRSGFGKGVNVVTYDGGSWHEYCFNCKRCSLNLSNKPFIAKGRDILCSDCGNDQKTVPTAPFARLQLHKGVKDVFISLTAPLTY